MQQFVQGSSFDFILQTRLYGFFSILKHHTELIRQELLNKTVNMAYSMAALKAELNRFQLQNEVHGAFVQWVHWKINSYLILFNFEYMLRLFIQLLKK